MQVDVLGEEQELQVGDYIEAREYYGSIMKIIKGEVIGMQEFRDFCIMQVYSEDSFSRGIRMFNSSKGKIDIIRRRGEW